MGALTPAPTTSEEVDVVARRYEAAESSNALAGEFGVHRATLVRHLRRTGVAVRYRVIAEQDLSVARNLYAHGESLAALAGRFGVAAGTVLPPSGGLGSSRGLRGTNQSTG